MSIFKLSHVKEEDDIRLWKLNKGGKEGFLRFMNYYRDQLRYKVFYIEH